ncbi:uncharacterized protein LOC128965597 [Oppia nitens]|uniref:uncharacterized protein LOC128965597 n=1 Tax=Oppia nitens TaxID=1686743 RepID=UPI0023DC13ED|nr:uncharacterized protein LOC128965597 [Oppia nitens]
MSQLVTIKMMANTDRQVLAHFGSTGVPADADYKLKADDNKASKLHVLDVNTNMNFVGQQSGTKASEYYIGVRKGNVLEVYPVSMYRMKAVVESNERTQISSQASMTFKEQLEEMKEKFGSRRTQRQLASKRKYAIEFGEEDVEHIETQTKEVETSINEVKPKRNIDILPQQTRDAISVEEVYDMNEIIIENERFILKQYEEEMFAAIDNTFIKFLLSSSNNSDRKLMAIYIDLIITLVSLKVPDWKKSDPLPSLNSDVKDFLFERYITTVPMGPKKVKYSLINKEKDRLHIYGIILSFMLFNYKPIELETLQKAFKIQPKQLKKLVEIIGCYIESIKNISGINSKFAVLRVPLNEYKEAKETSFRRK